MGIDKKNKNLGVVYNKDGDVFMGVIGGKKNEEVVLASLTRHSDLRCGRCWKKSSICY